MKTKSWSLRNYTGTLNERDALGELIARMFGFVDGRKLFHIDSCKNKECQITGVYNANMKLVFGTKSGKIFSCYVNGKKFKKLINEYFKHMFLNYHGKNLWQPTPWIHKDIIEKAKENDLGDDLPF